MRTYTFLRNDMPKIISNVAAPSLLKLCGWNAPAQSFPPLGGFPVILAMGMVASRGWTLNSTPPKRKVIFTSCVQGRVQIWPTPWRFTRVAPEKLP
jgi:hypothetical protein